MLQMLKQLFGQNSAKYLHVCCPMEGEIVPLSKVNDLAFSDELLGKGIAILPKTGKVFAPFNGRVTQMFASNYAISLVSNSGIQVLIHIGIDTIKLNGQHFTPFAQTGSLVQKGDVLLEFDLAAVAAKGFETISPIVICNTNNFKKIKITSAVSASPLDEIIWLQK